MFQQGYNISSRKEFPPHILRIAKIAKQKSRINSKAKDEQNQSQTVQPPYLKLKRKSGAPKGNRNALKHGLYSGEMTEMKLRVRRAVADLKLAGALVRLEAARMDAETAAMRRAAERAWRLSQKLPSQPPDRSACDGAHSAPR